MLANANPAPDLPEDADAHALQRGCVEELGEVGGQGHLHRQAVG